MIRLRYDVPSRCTLHHAQEQLSLLSVRVAERRLELGTFKMYDTHELTGFFCCVEHAGQVARDYIEAIAGDSNVHRQFTVRL